MTDFASARVLVILHRQPQYHVMGSSFFESSRTVGTYTKRTTFTSSNGVLIAFGRFNTGYFL